MGHLDATSASLEGALGTVQSQPDTASNLGPAPASTASESSAADAPGAPSTAGSAANASSISFDADMFDLELRSASLEGDLRLHLGKVQSQPDTASDVGPAPA